MFGNNPNLKNLEPVVIMGRGHSGTRILAWICHDLGLRMGVDASRETGDADDLVFTRKIKKIAQRNLGMTSMSDIKAPMTEAATHFCQNRINTSKLAQHRENDPNDVAAVTKRILPTLKRYGYE
jgi:hypothetical protein